MAERRARADEMQRSGVMLSLLKSFGRLCPAKGPPAGSPKQPRGEKPRTTVADDVGLVVVWSVVVGAEVVGGGVEDVEEGVVVLLGVERLEDGDEVAVVEETVGDKLDELLESEDVELVEGWLDEDELGTTSVVVELVDEDVTEELEETGPLIEEDEGTVAELELDIKVVLLTTELELDPPTGERLLYIDSLEDPPHYSSLVSLTLLF